MPNIKSAKKRVKVIAVKTARNKANRTALKTEIKKANAAIASGDEDALLYRAAELIIDSGKGSTSLLQRRLGVGYGRAAKMLDCLEEMGVIGHPNGTKPREVLVTRDRLDEIMKSKA